MSMREKAKKRSKNRGAVVCSDIREGVLRPESGGGGYVPASISQVSRDSGRSKKWRYRREHGSCAAVERVVLGMRFKAHNRFGKTSVIACSLVQSVYSVGVKLGICKKKTESEK